VAVTASGRIAWRTPLATRGAAPIGPVTPVLAGPVAVFAQDGIVHGLRIASGRQLWAWRGGQAVYGMWRWGGLVAVLTDQVSAHAAITGLDAATGAVRWIRPLPGSGLLGGQAVTGDGGLAMIRADGVLQVISLADGRVRWARPLATGAAGPQPVLQLAGQVVVQTDGGAGRAAPLLAYDLATGRPAWRTGLPTFVQVPPVPATGGLLIQPADPGYACAVAGVAARRGATPAAPGGG
jgi:outer membrane protein assembly factor BamB